MIEITEQLRLILKISGFTQEKLARELGVSFVTLNRWIAKKAVPRLLAAKRIEELYKAMSGQSIIPNTLIEAKEQLLVQKQQKFPDPLALILSRPDLISEYILKLTYHTNRIEGSTLTEHETEMVLFQGKALPNHTLTEHLEAKNHETALRYLFSVMQQSEVKIDEPFVCKLHSMLMSGIRDDAGHYRDHGVRIVGANVPTANPLRVPDRMKTLLERNTEKELSFTEIATFHAEFEQIHPFSDGNGRVGRLLIHAFLLRKKIPPALILQEERHLYYAFLQKAQIQADFSPLTDFLLDAVLRSFELLEEK